MARYHWRNTLIAVALSFLAGLAGIWVGLNSLSDGGSNTVNLHERIHHEFILNASQKTALHALEGRYASSQKQYIKDLKAANFELAAAIKAHHTLSPEVVLAEQEYLKVLGAFQTETLRHIFAMRAILSHVQAQKFDDIVLRSLHDITE
ncbi:MAG: heavy metal resistance protein [Robiginitomaculum sp.]|nr:MAG: heavy metal resistance protein [Robiginitomaculum sp.]